MKVKLTLDIALLVLFAALCNTNATGTLTHEVLGLVYVGLLAIHLLLNRKWAAALFKGKLRGGKPHIGAIVNALLFADFAVILATGIRASHDLFRFADKASTWVIMAHIICGVMAAGFVLAHVLLHLKVITKGKAPAKAAVCIVLVVAIGYSLFGGIQGALHHRLPKNDTHTAQGAGGEHQPKNGERK
jgi:hypothetical protein